MLSDCQSGIILIFMDTQKTIDLQATSDVEHLIADTFLMEGQLTDLYLFPNELKLLQKNKEQTIAIDFNLSFAITQQPKAQVILELNTPDQRIQLVRDFWPRANEWQSLMLSLIKRKDFHQFFKPTKKIGKGNFANVYLAQDLKNCREVAIKAFMKEASYRGDGQRGIENQIKMMRTIHSLHVVQLHGVYQTTNSIYLSMEYLRGTTLDLYLRKNKSLSAQERRKVMRALLTGLLDLKRAGIVHRDIKPQNIMVSNDLETIKIVDLGLATRIDDPSYIFVKCGTPGYIAPEILKIKDVNSARLGVESDMFSLGAVYFKLLYGKSLFSGKAYDQVLKSNCACRIELEETPSAACGEIQLLRTMLQIKPHRRITPEEALRCPFLQERRRQTRRPLQVLDNAHLPSNWICIDQ